VVGVFIGGAYDRAVAVFGAVGGLVARIIAGSWKKRLLQRVSEVEARFAPRGQQPMAGVAVMPVVFMPRQQLS
jgi:hypothetical protein